ncbi:hypothetical protein [Bradyrhizobium sp. AS23.2]|uniref:hypothetical protein n=1 Tax=Bradyrhizobium sp. AS23.2 TaxID=1680155 RepID=UPI00093D227E|nr:hypothetical protein [Bradyrhizobium sp. AS23.2]OKO86816.1 hypothetical protein AC630_01850 [Bradyrhizobium sp. AS23.2]
MLVVTIDLVPGGFEPMRRTIASMRIANISDLADISDYRVETVETSNPLIGTPERTAQCVIQGHARAQSVWALLARASEEITNLVTTGESRD